MRRINCGCIGDGSHQLIINSVRVGAATVMGLTLDCGLSNTKIVSIHYKYRKLEIKVLLLRTADCCLRVYAQDNNNNDDDTKIFLAFMCVHPNAYISHIGTSLQF